MKTKILGFVTILLMLVIGMSLVGCDMNSINTPPSFNDDIQSIVQESITIEHFTPVEDEIYYTSPGLSLWMSVNGAYMEMDYFSVDGNKRVYDNMYFYEDDYFYMVTDDNKYLYAGLSDSTSSEYAEAEKQSGEDVQVNVKKTGIYRLTFDVDTLKFDMEYKADIETPVYYTIKNCSIYSEATKWVEMSVNPVNPDEFYIDNFSIGAGEIVSFFSNIHTSNYNVTLDDSCNNKYASARRTNVTANVGGNYNIYINAKTYVVRLELINPDASDYSCVYYDGENFIALEPYDAEIPYIFHYTIVVDKKYQSVPDFHTSRYKTYELSLGETNLLMGSDNSYYFKQTGIYDLIINLKTFEISAELKYPKE